MSYSIHGYTSMLADRRRMEGYESAIARTVFHDAVVLDIGTGPGVMAILACRHGASRVYAIEPAPIIGAAAEIIAANGFSDRITLMEGLSTEIELPERVDVIISDLRGVLPHYSSHIPSIIDARERFLKQGGHLVPEHDVVSIALVEDGKRYSTHLQLDVDRSLSLDVSALHRLLSNSWARADLRADQLLSEAATLFEVDYRKVVTASVTGSVDLTARREGLAHGFAMWFDGDLVDGIRLENAPGPEAMIYGQAFFPFTKPLALQPGQSVHIRIDARLVGEDYVWRWTTTAHDDESAAGVKFDQSTFLGSPLPHRRLARNAEDYVCSLTGRGVLEREILSRMDGARTNREIAEAVAQFSKSFDEAFETVTRLADQLGS